jgi:hypothetical protein
MHPQNLNSALEAIGCGIIVRKSHIQRSLCNARKGKRLAMLPRRLR